MCITMYAHARSLPHTLSSFTKASLVCYARGGCGPGLSTLHGPCHDGMVPCGTWAPCLVVCPVQKRPGAGSFIAGLTAAEPFCANTTNHEFLRPAWKLLLARIGDELMLHLLQHTSIFLPVGGLGAMQDDADDDADGPVQQQKQQQAPAASGVAGGSGGDQPARDAARERRPARHGARVIGGVNYLQLAGRPLSEVRVNTHCA